MEEQNKEITIAEILMYVSLLILVLLAWLSTIDDIAYAMNIESIKSTTAAFVIIKAFNALISLAQNIPFLGAIMTPYDDFLDRMSWVMLISLMSLGLQKIIIISVQSFLVNTVLSLSLVVLIANRFITFLSLNATRKAFKLFLVLLFIRFSIPLMTLTITTIESSTYEMQTKVSQQRVLELQDKLIGIKDLLGDDRKAQAIKKTNIGLKKEQNSNLVKQIDILQKQIDAIKLKAGEIFGFSIYSIKSVDQKTKDKIQNLETQISKLNASIKNNNDEINGLDNFFTFSDTKAKIKTAIENLNTFMSEVFDVFLTWVIMFFFKNIFFPILFLWLVYKMSNNAISSN
jgi:hypothetical protein